LFLSVGQCYNDKSLGAWTLGTRRVFRRYQCVVALKKNRDLAVSNLTPRDRFVAIG